MIDALASQRQYVEHLAPIWRALGDQMGIFYLTGIYSMTEETEGIPHKIVGYPKTGGPILVAGYVDEQATGRPSIYLEHGAGQTYRGDATAADQPSYSGSSGHQRVRLFLCPSETVADRWRARYDRTPAVAVGCPKMDRAHRWMANHPWQRPADREQPATVAITFHSDSLVCPESRSAVNHYEPGLEAAIGRLEQAGVTVIGHGHPRLWRTLEPMWRRLRIEPVENLAEVMYRADVLAGDNTSALPEFASLGKPVVWMNAPWYRRDIEHGGRFWDWPLGQVTCDGPGELADAIMLALEDPADVRAARRAMVGDIYVACDGKATERAVEAILPLSPPSPAGRPGALYI